MKFRHPTPHVLPVAGLGVGVAVAVWAVWSRLAALPSFHLGVALAFLTTFGLVWTFGIRYPDVGWMLVITALLTVQAAFEPTWTWLYLDGAGAATARFALALAYGAFLLAFFRAPGLPARLDRWFAAAIAAFAAVALALPAPAAAAIGLGGALPGWLAALCLAVPALGGLRALTSLPPKRRRYVIAVVVWALVAAGAFAVQARREASGAAVATPLLHQVVAAVFALILLADLVIFHRNYFKEKASRMRDESERAEDQARAELSRAIRELVISKDRGGDFHGFRYDFHFRPHPAAGGDWLFAWDAGGGEKRLLFGEIVATGAAAALGVAAVVSLLHDCQARGMALPAALRFVNARLIGLFARSLTSTCTAVSIAADGTVELFNCGGAGFFAVSAHEARYFAASSTPLGVSEDLEMAQMPLALADGDVLFAATDGVIASPAALRRILDWLEDAVEASPDAAAIRDRLLELGPSPEAGAAPTDDQTLLFVSKRPA